MIERLIRLLRIITILQANPGILARELAERCDSTERTVYRDMEILSAAHMPILNMGHGKGYAFIGSFSLYPLDWTEQEALAFSMLPSVLEQIKDLLPQGYESAYEKVLATYNKEKKNRDFAHDIARIIQLGTPAYRADQANHLFPIIQAILTGKTIHAVYHTQSRNELSARDIDPYCLVPRDHRFYLIGYCHTAGEVRTFRVSRMRDVEILERDFEQGEFNIRQYLKHTWSIERGERRIRFKVKFSADVARYIKEEELFVNPRMTEYADGSLLFEVTLNADREFLGWLAQYGPDAEILEPKSYRRAMRERLESWLEMYRERN